jgi:hypothetical protein
MRKAYIILMKKLRQDMPFKKGGDINFPNIGRWIVDTSRIVNLKYVKEEYYREKENFISEYNLIIFSLFIF